MYKPHRRVTETTNIIKYEKSHEHVSNPHSPKHNTNTIHLDPAYKRHITEPRYKEDTSPSPHSSHPPSSSQQHNETQGRNFTIDYRAPEGHGNPLQTSIKGPKNPQAPLRDRVAIFTMVYTFRCMLFVRFTVFKLLTQRPPDRVISHPFWHSQNLCMQHRQNDRRVNQRKVQYRIRQPQHPFRKSIPHAYPPQLVHRHQNPIDHNTLRHGQLQRRQYHRKIQRP
eukprot:TRINITY_DN3874_c0_g1_i10.p2 TRINITY_DN3874_c0_g1~~TRINITY_DN3874_c0_g1_i10.p2  ORF type:complete len:224 (+),score=-29.83 TRINITY_DN3874_c0_g1_i10:399-1070(+)